MKTIPAAMTVLCALFLRGCTEYAGPASEASDDHHRPGSGMHRYERSASDPDWLARAAEFHGHLGPWSTIGAMIGRDAVQRLGNPDGWDLLVICHLPPQQRITPTSCIMDGLQVSTGATMGKRNIAFVWDRTDASTRLPRVSIIHLPRSGEPAGFSYVPTAELAQTLRGIGPPTVEEVSRQLANSSISSLVEVRPLSVQEIRHIRQLLGSRED